VRSLRGTATPAPMRLIRINPALIIARREAQSPQRAVRHAAQEMLVQAQSNKRGCSGRGGKKGKYAQSAQQCGSTRWEMCRLLPNPKAMKEGRYA